MIVRLNHFIRQFCRRKSSGVRSLSSKAGQTALILLVFAALGLVLYAVALNVGRVSQYKVLTMRAANSAAAMMASFIASYAEKLLIEQLGGRLQVCFSTSVLSAIIGFIILIILIIISIFIPGFWAAVAAYVGGMAVAVTMVVIAVVMSLLSLVMQITVIQPSITEMWNRMMADTMTIENQALERGIQNALREVVTDQVSIPDFFDTDSDGFYGDLKNAADSSSGYDYIGRFAHYYTKRLEGIPAVTDYTPITNFQSALRDLLYKDPLDNGDTQGLYDPGSGVAPCSQAHPPAECDPCCVSEYLRDGDGLIVMRPIDEFGAEEAVRVRPDCCDDPGVRCSFNTSFNQAVPVSCAERSPYYTNDGNATNDFGYIYDATYENSRNNDRNHPGFIPPYFASVREKIGRDDMNKYYHVNPFEPNWHSDPISDRQLLVVAPETPAMVREDAPGVFKPPVYTAGMGYADPDEQLGIFPFFHKIADWGVGLTNLNYGTVIGDELQCHWCDANGGLGACVSDLKDPQLVLPRAPGAFNGGWCMDNANDAGAGDFPQVADGVPDFGADVLAPDNACATDVGGWKKGFDRFCSTVAPYHIYCAAKHLNTPDVVDAACSTTDPETGVPVAMDCQCSDRPGFETLFDEDHLDEFYLAIAEFIQWAIPVTTVRPALLYAGFQTWFDSEFARWITVPGNPTPGALNTLIAELTPFESGIDTWLTSDYTVADCGDSWCVPDASCPCSKAGEQTGTGGVQSVIDCLDFNANDTVDYPVTGPTSGTMSATGNAEKFQACASFCSFETCHDLPRSLDPSFCSGFEPFVLNPAQIPNFEQVYSCLASNTAPPASFAETFELTLGGEYPASDAGSVMACAANCPGLPASMSDSGGDTVTLTPAFWVPPVIQYSCGSGNSCDPTSAFMTAVNAAATLDCSAGAGFFHADCDDHKPAFLTCLAAVGTCAGVPASNNYADMQALSCRSACEDLPMEWVDDFGVYSYNIPAFTDFSIVANVTSNACADTVDFFPEVAAMLALSEERCSDAAYLAAVQASADEAENQVVKFRKRKQFLENRQEEAVEAHATIDETITLLNDFVNSSEVADLINMATTYSPSQSGSLPSLVIYAWQDAKRDDVRFRRISSGGFSPVYDGYWHIVKVEARAPKRCNNCCHVGGVCGDPEKWPWVQTWTSNWGTKRCYALRDYEGMVKVRVIRWDESRAPSWRTGLKFPNRMPIWDFRFNYPGAPDADLGIKAACEVFVDPILNVAPYLNYNWDKGFMVNKSPEFDCGASADPNCGNILTCWNLLHAHLAQGVMSESCAQYEYGAGGLQVIFRECDQDFLDGNN